MNQIETAALRLALVTLAFVAIAAALWWLRRPRTAHSGPRVPVFSRKAKAALDHVEIAPSRLARISGKAPLDRLSETGVSGDPAPDPASPPPPGETLAAGTILETMIADVERQAVRLEKADGDAEPPAVALEKTAAAATTLRLVPQIPPRDAISTTSWLGGRPRLPAGMEWPKIDDQPADFLAQIDCARLPRELWGGLGPRDGALAFFIHRRRHAVRVLHMRDAVTPVAPPFALNDPEGWFGPHGGLGFGDLASFAVRAFPEWPVDPVAVRPGDADPRETGDPDEPGRALYERGYDIADPAFHPFDWGSMTAMVALLEMRLDLLAIEEASPAATGDDDPDETRRRIAVNREAADRAREIIAIVHDSASRDAFSPGDATAVMAALHAIRWAAAIRTIDPETGAEQTETVILPLTTHRADANLWVHDYQTILFDRAKHAWCANPDHLSAPARAFYEPWWQTLAAREMAAMGHEPFAGIPDYDAERDVVLLELPTSGLMSRRFGDNGDLVVTIARAELAIGDFSKPRVHIGN